MFLILVFVSLVSASIIMVFLLYAFVYPQQRHIYTACAIVFALGGIGALILINEELKVNQERSLYRHHRD